MGVAVRWTQPRTPPTPDSQPLFPRVRREAPAAIGNYARYSLRRLEGILNSGPSGFVPSVDEIQAYKERPPILATIELVDGTPLTEDLPITPDLNVSKVCTAPFPTTVPYPANAP